MLNALIRQIELEECVFTAKDVWQSAFSGTAPASEYSGCPVCYPKGFFSDKFGWSLNSFGLMVMKSGQHIVVAQHDIADTIYQARRVGSWALNDSKFRLATTSETFNDYRTKNRLIDILLEGFDPARHGAAETRSRSKAYYV